MAKAIKDDINIFAKRLNELIKEKKLVHEDVAQGIGVTRQGVGKWVSGDSVPDVLTVAKLAKFFNVSVDYLAGNSDVRTADMDIRAVCDYTGLNEYSVIQLHFDYSNCRYYAMYGSDYNASHYSEYNTLLNRLISEYYLGRIAFFLLDIKEYSEEYMNLDDEEKKIPKEKVTNILNYPAIYLKYQCDSARYDLVQMIEDLADEFDQRRQVKDNGNNNQTNQ